MKTLNKIIAVAVLAATTLNGCVSTENGRTNTETTQKVVNTNVLEGAIQNYLDGIKNVILQGDCEYPDWEVEADFKNFMEVYGTRAVKLASQGNNNEAKYTLRRMVSRVKTDYRPGVSSDLTKPLQGFGHLIDLLE